MGKKREQKVNKFLKGETIEEAIVVDRSLEIKLASGKRFYIKAMADGWEPGNVFMVFGFEE